MAEEQSVLYVLFTLHNRMCSEIVVRWGRRYRSHLGLQNKSLLLSIRTHFFTYDGVIETFPIFKQEVGHLLLCLFPASCWAGPGLSHSLSVCFLFFSFFLFFCLLIHSFPRSSFVIMFSFFARGVITYVL